MTDRVDALLANAVSAARQRAQLGVDDGAATRLRLRESLTRGSTKRRRRLTIIAAVIASLFGSTAYALVTGWRPPSLSRTTVAAVPPAIEPPVIVERPLAERRVTIVRPTAAPPIAIVEPAKPVVASKPIVKPATKPNVPVDTPAPVTQPAPARSEELAAYRIAHEAHFRGNDPEAALAAWNAYLAKFPDGQLAPEARYDRALVLIKLKRINEARAALAPFASAPVGSYRQREAAKLIDALR
jgi:hypothetical protein